jgi:protein phosphatase
MIAEKDFAGRQTRGQRGHQEDAYAYSDIIGKDGRVEGLLVVVADGMGGHTSGEQASEVALESFISGFHQSSGTIKERFKKALLAANGEIAAELKRFPELDGMGTTLLAAGVTGDGVEWVSVGDSPLYLFRDKKLTRLNADHSFRAMLHQMVDKGELTPTDAAKHPLRNLLRAALTGGDIDLMDLSEKPVELRQGDIVVAGTDGLQTLHDEEIAAALAESAEATASGLAADLLKTVLNAGNPKQDNTTAAVIKAEAGGFTTYVPAAAKENAKNDTETIVMNPLQKGKG